MKITVTVKPGSSKGPLVLGQDDGSILLYLKERALDGKANEAAIEVLARHFGVPKSHVSLRIGASSRKKIFEIEGL